MKKRELNTLNLKKTSISNLDSLLKGGALPHTQKLCPNDTGCVGPARQTCGIINCDLPSNLLACDAS